MKKEEILKKFNNLLPDLESYAEILQSKNKKLIRFLRFKEKFILKASAILLKKIIKFRYYQKINLFYGRKMEVYLSDADATSLYFLGCLYGSAEALTIHFLLKNLKPNDIFYDIGANYGFYTLLVQEIIKEGEIHSFEPHPKIFKLLKRNARLNIFQNTFLNQKALSNKNGELWFYDHFDKRHSWSSSLIDRGNNVRKIKVNSITLDEYIKNHKPPTIMKIDIEGGEYLFLNGTKRTIEEFRPKIIMEVFTGEYHQKAVQFLLNEGYKIYSFNKEGQINPLRNETIQDFFQGKE